MTASGWQVVSEYDFKEIIYEKKRFENGYAARITFNRPEKYNAITLLGIQETALALNDASHDRRVGVVVITGTGDKAFCTGGDVGWEEKGGLASLRVQGASIDTSVRRCRKPVIAAVKGYAIGGGNHWAYITDFTIAAENAVFGQVGPRVGSPADGYVVSYLTRIIGAKKAREMWMLCRRYSAQEALAMGLVNTVVPLEQLEEEVEKWCNEILDKSPSCIEILKASFDSDIDYLEHTYHNIADKMYPHHLGSEEQLEGSRAFLEKRKPNFAKFRMGEEFK